MTNPSPEAIPSKPPRGFCVKTENPPRWSGAITGIQATWVTIRASASGSKPPRPMTSHGANRKTSLRHERFGASVMMTRPFVACVSTTACSPLFVERWPTDPCRHALDASHVRPCHVRIGLDRVTVPHPSLQCGAAPKRRIPRQVPTRRSMLGYRPDPTIHNRVFTSLSRSR
jgi:hypothetical protein